MENNIEYPFGMEKLIAGIEEINPAMPSRGNYQVVEEGQGVDSMQKILHWVMGKDFQMNIKAIRWNGIAAKAIENDWDYLHVSNSTHFTHTITKI